MSISQYDSKMPNGKLQGTREPFERRSYESNNRNVRIRENSLKAVKLPNIFAELSRAPRARRCDLGSHPTRAPPPSFVAVYLDT